MTATKTNWRQDLKDRMQANRQECIKCLRGNDYPWDDTKRTLKLMNALLRGIPNSLWPDNGPDPDSWDWDQVIVRSGSWTMTLSRDEDGRRLADLRHKGDDHSAWVKEHSKKNGVWLDHDIGGS